MTENIDRKKQIDFWVSLFNVGSSNCCTTEEAEKVLQNVSSMSFDDCIEEYCCESNDMYDVDYVEYDDLTDSFNRIKNSKQHRWIYFYYGVLSEYHDEILDILDCGGEFIADRDVLMTNMVCHIADMLNEVAYRVLIVEVNYVKSSGRLEGDTPEERAEYFSETMLRDREYVASVMADYPEMVRLFHIKIRNALSFFRKIITDTAENIGKIEAAVNNGKKLGRLMGIITGSGDTHNGGQSVARLIFENEKIVIYKPHSLKIDLAYNKVMEKVNDISESFGYGRFYLTRSFTAGESGWTEYISNSSEPDSIEEVRNYHRKLGILSCLLYILSAGDMHSENIIAMNESPVIIDLETVIQPRIVIEGSDIEKKVRDRIINSVKGTLVFPTHIVNNRNGKTIELGGIGNVEEQESAFDSNFIASIETDDVKLEKRASKIALNPNVLTKDNKRINAVDYFAELCDGFSQMYRYILENRESFGKLLCESFGDCLVRVIYRSTWIYGQLLDISYHPDLLGNSVDRLICLHRLGLGESDSGITAAEIADMRNGDIPMFQINSDSRGTELSEQALYSLSPLENICEKLRSLSETDLRCQLMVIKSCFSIISDNHTDYRYTVEANAGVSDNEYSEHIRLLCDKLFSNAIIGKRDDKDCCTWLGCIENNFGIIECQDVGDSLYYGRSGIAFALYCAYICTGEEEYLRKADMAIEITLAGLEAEDLSYIPWGAYDGIAGILLLLVFCREKFGRTEYDRYIRKILSHISDRDNFAEKTDILGGTAGILNVLTYICDTLSDEKIRNKSAEIIKKTTVDLYNRIRCGEAEEKHFVGYAHGEAGIISALVGSSKYADIPDIAQFAEDFLKEQNKAYSDKDNNWSRLIEEPNRFNYGWCHGAAGILLSRASLYDNGVRTETVITDLRNSLKAVKEQCFGRNYCLCHGDAGNLLILRFAAQVLGDTALKNEAEANLSLMLNEKIIPAAKEGRLLSGYDDNGLFCGIAGLIYAICKFKSYDAIPDIMGFRSE